jgi:hypothetical protein
MAPMIRCTAVFQTAALSSLTVLRTAGAGKSVIGMNWDKGYARQKDWQLSLNLRALGI